MRQYYTFSQLSYQNSSRNAYTHLLPPIIGQSALKILAVGFNVSETAVVADAYYYAADSVLAVDSAVQTDLSHYHYNSLLIRKFIVSFFPYCQKVLMKVGLDSQNSDQSHDFDWGCIVFAGNMVVDWSVNIVAVETEKINDSGAEIFQKGLDIELSLHFRHFHCFAQEHYSMD